MCGICAIIFENGEKMNIGELLKNMSISQQIRAQDSAGIATFNSNENGEILLQKLVQNTDTYFFSDQYVEPKDLPNKIKEIEDSQDNYIIGIGKHMRIMKDIGLAYELQSKYNVSNLTGTHGIGHIRIATSSRVKPLNSHPFATLSRPDLAIVHNGEITNYGRLKRDLELKGHKFVTECDSELIAVYLADRLLEHGDFEKANYELIDIIDGPCTYIAAVEDAIALGRDNFGMRKGVIGYSPQSDNYPGFIAFATDVSALDSIGANKEIHTPHPGNPEIFRRDKKFKLKR